MLRWLVLLLLLAVVSPDGAGATSIAIKSGRLGNVIYDTSPAAFDVIVASGFSGNVIGIVVTEVTDPYGALALHDEHAVNVPGLSSSTIHVTVPTSLKGRFAVTARLYDPSRTEPPLVSQTSGIAIVPPPVPGFDEASGVGYFAAPQESGAYDETPIADDIAGEMQDMGIKWVRYGYAWNHDARRDRPDTNDPSWLDTTAYETWVDAYRAHDITVMGNLSSTARWASTQPDNDTEITYQGIPVGLGEFWGAATPVTADYQLFLQTMQGRLAGRINDWEIWNEPESYLFFEPAFTALNPAGAAKKFAAVLNIASSTLKAMNPQARIIVATADSGNVSFEYNFVPLAGASLDAFGYHYADASAVAYQRTLFNLFGLTPPAFWNTEAYGGVDKALPSWIRQRSAGAEKIFFFIWGLYGGGVPTHFGVAPYGANYVPEPLAIGVRTLSDEIGRALPVRSFAIKQDNSLNGYIFQDGLRSVIAVVREADDVQFWAPTNPVLQVAVRVPAGTTSVRIIDAMGNAQTVAPIAGQVRLPLDGNPVYVEGVATDSPRPLDFIAFTNSACGNGQADPGEECDDGNTIDGDSCSNTCTYACPPEPLPNCPMDPSFASLLVKTNPRKPTAKKLGYKWNGRSVGPGLGDPVGTTTYAVCLYDQDTGGAIRKMTMAAAPGGMCGVKPCWVGKTIAFTYSDRDQKAEGLKKLQVKQLLDGTGSVRLTAGGTALPLPALPLTPPVIVQVQASNGSCWNSVFSESGVIRLNDTSFLGHADVAP